MAIATLSIDLEMRLAKLEQGLDKAARSTERASKEMTSRFDAVGQALQGVAAGVAAAFGGAAIAGFARRTLDGVDALNDLADSTGSSVENLSALEDIAARTGTGFDVVGGALTRFNAQLSAAANPASDAARVIGALGLSVSELQALDPAVAFQQVASALNGYADNADKARIVQELFGKSVREVAPLLKDAAAAGTLQATVTTEQALQAERLNKQIFELQKNFTDLSRVLIGSAATAINATTDLFREAAKEGQGFLETLLKQTEIARLLGLNKIANPYTEARKEVERIEQILSTGALRGNPLRQTEEALARAKAARDAFLGGGGRGDPRAFDSDGRLTVRPGLSLPSAAGGGGGSGGSGGAGPRASFGRVSITDLGDFEALQQVDVLQARDRIKAAEDAQRRLDSLIGRSGKVSEQITDLAALDKAFFDGTISAEEFNAGLGNIFQGLNDLPPAAKEATAQISEFAIQAQRNIQDALGDTLLRTLKGDFDSIGQLWLDLLLRMQAQAAASALNSYLFGAPGTQGGGALSGLFSTLFGGFRANGGSVAGNKAYMVGERGPELFMPGRSGTVIPNGAMGGVNINQTINVAAGASRAEVAAGMQAAKDAAVAAVFDAMRRGRATA